MKLSREDYYHQFPNHERYIDAGDANRSIMDTMDPRAFYRAVGGRVDFRPNHTFNRGGSVPSSVDHALSVIRR